MTNVITDDGGLHCRVQYMARVHIENKFLYFLQPRVEFVVCWSWLCVLWSLVVVCNGTGWWSWFGECTRRGESSVDLSYTMWNTVWGISIFYILSTWRTGRRPKAIVNHRRDGGGRRSLISLFDYTSPQFPISRVQWKEKGYLCEVKVCRGNSACKFLNCFCSLQKTFSFTMKCSPGKVTGYD